MNEFEKIPLGIFDKVKNNKQEFLNKFIDDLEGLFPETVKDGIVDFQALLNRFGEYEEEAEEKYNMTWIGKSKAIQEADEDIYGRTLKYVEDESKNPETTENLYIEGDNLEVLKLLRQSYRSKIKMIYIDPPYNTGNDFVYKDDFTMTKEEYDKISGAVDEHGERLVKNTKDDGRYHSDWLNMMYPRLKVAKDLLKDDGVIFISIDDNEVENIIKICSELFGEENFVECITWNKRIPKNDKGIGNIHEYILIFTKSTHYRHEFIMRKEGIDEINLLISDMKKKNIPLKKAEELIKELYNKKGYDRGITLYNMLDENYELWGKINMCWPNGNTVGPRYEVLHPITKKPVNIPERGWRWKGETFNEAVDYENIEICTDGTYLCGSIWFGKDENMQPSSVKYLKEVEHMLLRSIISLKSDGGIEAENIFENKNYFPYPKPTKLIKKFLYSINDKNALVLDFFSGSSTTAHAVMDLNAEYGGNRKFIMVQLPEPTDEKSEASKADYKNIAEIGKERIRRAGEKILEENKDKDEIENLDIGFKVFKTVDTNLKMIKDTIEEGISIEEHKAISIKDEIDFNPHFTDTDVVYEMILRREDITLTEEVVLLDNIGDRTYLVGNTILVCLEDAVTEDMAKKIGEIDGDLSWIIMRDSAFEGNINLKINTVNLLRSIVKENHEKEQKIYWI